MDLEFITLQKVRAEHYSRLVQIQQASWDHLDFLTIVDFHVRAKQGQTSFVAMGIEPQGIIQTVGLESLDQLKEGNYHHLMSLPPISDPKYRLCMDVAIAKKANGRGLGRDLINWVIFNIAAYEPTVERVLTYTPVGMEGWHIEKNGAQLTDIEAFARARLDHKVEEVVILDYTERLTEYRNSLMDLSQLIIKGEIPINLIFNPEEPYN